MTAYEPIVISTAGLAVPGGRSLDQFWDTVLAAKPQAQPYRCDLPGWDRTFPAGLVADFDPTDHFPRAELRRLDRLHQLSLVATADALAAYDERINDPLTAVVGGSANRAADYLESQFRVMVERPSRANPLTIPLTMGTSHTAHITGKYDMVGPSITVNGECATGVMMLGQALLMIRAGAADRVVLTAADACATPAAMAFFSRTEALSTQADVTRASRPFDTDRDGFVIGEGAVTAVVETASAAIAAGREPIGVVYGYGHTTDTHHLLAPDPSGGAAATTMQMALATARLRPRDIASVNAHATSTVLNDRCESRAIEAVFGTATPTTGVKGVTGHMFAASGLAEALIACRTAETGLVPPVAGTSQVADDIGADIVIDEAREVGPGLVIANSFGFGGHNASVIIGPASEL